MSDAYEFQRTIFRDVSTAATLTAASDDTTLITGKTSHTIYVQHLDVFITTDAAVSWVFKSHTSGKIIFEIPASPGDSTWWQMDWGPDGIALTEGENLLLDVSGTGLAGSVTVQAYLKPSSTMTPSAV